MLNKLPKGSSILAITYTPSIIHIEEERKPYVSVWIENGPPITYHCETDEEATKLHRRLVDSMFHKIRRFGHDDPQ